AGSVDRGDVAPPYGTDKKNFIAQFSNIGRELDCTGPGVGVISTVPDKAYAVMSGTSMATPAVTGLATRLLGKNPGLPNAARDPRYSEEGSSPAEVGLRPGLRPAQVQLSKSKIQFGRTAPTRPHWPGNMRAQLSLARAPMILT